MLRDAEKAENESDSINEKSKCCQFQLRWDLSESVLLLPCRYGWVEVFGGLFLFEYIEFALEDAATAVAGVINRITGACA